MSSAFWTDRDSALSWVANDAQGDLLQLPRLIAAEIVALDHPEAALVADIGSGPGDFLGVFLERFRSARGIWSDVSEAMADVARTQLAGYGGRVDYRILDMSDLTALPDNIDVVMTSRAAHHLTVEELHTFYQQAAQHLAPGGWLINLDHFGPTDMWNTRLREARKQLIPRTDTQASHPHTYPFASVDDHLQALRAAAFTDVETPWRGFVSALFMARRDG